MERLLQVRHLLLVSADPFPLQSIHRVLEGCTLNIFLGRPGAWSADASLHPEDETYSEEVDVV